MVKKGKLPKAKDGAAKLAEIEKPQIKWGTIGLILAAFAVLWITAFMMHGFIEGEGWSWIPVGIVGLLTLAGIGFGIYVWRLTRRSRGIVDILAQATSKEGRQRAIEQLEAGDPKDAMNALARAQLMSAENKPQEAIAILEGVDIAKAPAVVQDDVRANLSLLYLMNGRTSDARTLVDALRLDRQPNAKAKAMYAAVSAEAYARTGRPDEAQKLLETYDADDPAYGDIKGMLLRAQVYTYLKLKKRGRAQTSMQRLAKVDPNMLGPWVSPGVKVHPDIKRMAMDALRSQGVAPKMKMQVQRK